MTYAAQTAPQLVELDRFACMRLLCEGHVGRLAVVVDRQPHIVPVSYTADDDGNVAFRTGPATVLTKVDLERVAFEIDGIDEQSRCGWSVCVHGFGREITDASDSTSRYLRERLGEAWAPGPRPRYFAIYPIELTGRRIEASAVDEHVWMGGIPWS
jgi:nitroimidazol reductase NimA-like FMN-containing flavoprotein (pyridoxamine 5'-phosphate oxidase superfamily)